MDDKILEDYANLELVKVLKSNGFRITEARLKIIGCLEEKKHFKLEDIVAIHKDKFDDDINLQSLYNIVNLLVELDILKKRHSRVVGVEYEVLDHSHIHIYKIGDTKKRHLDNEEEIVTDIINLLESRFNFKVDRIDLEIKLK